MNAWELVKQTLAASLSSESFENWVVPTTLAKTEGDTLIVSVPDEATRAWMEREYAPQ
ncbi:MAG: DnaA N-terminal domain-containing protein, partial [Acidobacteriota bacterium]